MSTILMIPDVHLKTWMFSSADNIMSVYKPDYCVFLGDLLDDWNKENYVDLYKEIIDRAIAFKQKFPNTLFCWGNHDLAYTNIYGQNCSGHSSANHHIISHMVNQYEREVEPKVVQTIDNMLFSHAGIDSYLIEDLEDKSPQAIADMFNTWTFDQLYQADSPVWLRPYTSTDYYDKYIQIIGHNPIAKPVWHKNVLMLDTFCLEPNLSEFGAYTFIAIDTEDLSLQLFDRWGRFITKIKKDELNDYNFCK